LPSSDSTKVFVELGYLKRSNDSKITWSKEWIPQNLCAVKTDSNCKSDLSIVSQYRILDFEANTQKKESTLNSRIIYTDRFFETIGEQHCIWQPGTFHNKNSRT
jgi:hypothetical protein